MTPQDEYVFLSNFSSAARRSDSLQALENFHQLGWAALAVAVPASAGPGRPW